MKSLMFKIIASTADDDVRKEVSTKESNKANLISPYIR